MGFPTKQQQQQRSNTFGSARSESTGVSRTSIISGKGAKTSYSPSSSSAQNHIHIKGNLQGQTKSTNHEENYFADSEGLRVKPFLAESHQTISLQGNRAPVRAERATHKPLSVPSSQPIVPGNNHGRPIAPERVRPGLSSSSPIVPRTIETTSAGGTATARSYSITSPSAAVMSAQSAANVRNPSLHGRTSHSMSPTNRAIKEAAVDEFRSKTMQRLAEKKEQAKEEQKALSKMAKAVDERKQEIEDEKHRHSKEAMRRRAEIYAVNGLMRKLEESKMDAFSDKMEGGKSPYVYT